jgi:hypothetical protein
MQFFNSLLSNQAPIDYGDIESFDSLPLNETSVNYGDIAMSRGTARQIVDRFTKEAINKNITPEAFLEGFSYLKEVGQSPDFTRRTIRNTLKSPIGGLILENPGLIKQSIDQFGGAIEDVNPALAGKHMGLLNQIMQEAKKDNLFRPNVTYDEIKREIQQPMYGALMDWTKNNLNNSKVQNIIKKSPIGINEAYGPRGLVPNIAGFDPKQFGIKMTPEAQKLENEYYKKQAWEKSPQGIEELKNQQTYAEQFIRQRKEIEARLKNN